MRISRRQFAVGLIVIGLVANNYAFLHDLLVRGSAVIWMGPKTWALVAVSALIVLAGLWLLTRTGERAA